MAASRNNSAGDNSGEVATAKKTARDDSHRRTPEVGRTNGDTKDALKPQATIRAVSPDLVIQDNNAGKKEDAAPTPVNTSPQSTQRRRPSSHGSSERPKTMIEVTPEKPPTQPANRSRTKTLEDLPTEKPSSTSQGDMRPKLQATKSTASMDDCPTPDAESFPAPPRDQVKGNAFSKSRSKSESGRGPGVVHESKKSADHRHRLVKPPKRPITPVQKEPELVGGTLPSPIRISNANRILELMKASKGSMEGDVELRSHDTGNWSFGHCLIEEQGSLVQKSSNKQAQVLLPDLRRCKVKTAPFVAGQPSYLIITVEKSSMSLHLQPLEEEDLDRWLAALIFWQPVRARTSSDKKSRHRGASLPLDSPRPRTERRPSADGTSLKDAAIIKVGKVLLLQQGGSSSRAHRSRKASMSRSAPPPAPHSWQTVQCVLRENGEFKLYTETDVAVVSVIQLSELSRCAIQRLDPSVLDQPYCIAIYPNYSVSSTILSLIQPIYLSFESNVLYEVWLVLLRAFAVPELYGPSERQRDVEAPQGHKGAYLKSTNEMFRVERTISIRVIEARLWPPRPKTGPDGTSTSRNRSSKKDPSIGNYLAEVLLDGQLRARTIQVDHTNNPFWRDDFDFHDLPGSAPSLSIMLKRPADQEKPGMLSGLLDSQAGAPNLSSAIMSDTDSQEYYGKMDLNVDSLDQSEDSESWWGLTNRDKENIGEILLRTRAEELIVLMSSDYRQLSELLLQSPSKLSTAIAEAVPGKLQRLSEVLLNIYQVSGQANRYLMNLIEDEIDGIQQQHHQQQQQSSPSLGVIGGAKFRTRVGSNDSADFRNEREMMKNDMGLTTVQTNLLFRGNSLLTKSFELHMSRIGKEYLEDTLASSIRTINESDMDCEVDPARLSSSTNLEPNWRNLMNLFRIIWSSVHGSAQRCPKELRTILRHIRNCAENRWGKYHGTVSYSSVSGFLFLRFFCPAILNPKLFGLLKAHPQPRAQRALTLVAKSLQGLANMSVFGAKEPWMEPMNHFLSSRRQEFKDFIDQVCAIDPADELSSTFASNTPTHLPPSYATPITILARLPPTAREGFPSLPYLIDQPLQFSALVNLWLDAEIDLDIPPPKSPTSPKDGPGVSPYLKQFDAICHSIHDMTKIRLAKAEREQQAAPTVTTPNPSTPALMPLATASTNTTTTSLTNTTSTRTPPTTATTTTTTRSSISPTSPNSPTYSSPTHKPTSASLSSQRRRGGEDSDRHNLTEDDYTPAPTPKTSNASLSHHHNQARRQPSSEAPLHQHHPHHPQHHHHNSSRQASNESYSNPHSHSHYHQPYNTRNTSAAGGYADGPGADSDSSDDITIFPLPQPITPRPPPGLIHSNSGSGNGNGNGLRSRSPRIPTSLQHRSPDLLPPRTSTPLPPLASIESLTYRDTVTAMGVVAMPPPQSSATSSPHSSRLGGRRGGGVASGGGFQQGQEMGAQQEWEEQPIAVPAFTMAHPELTIRGRRGGGGSRGSNSRAGGGGGDDGFGDEGGKAVVKEEKGGGRKWGLFKRGEKGRG